MFMFLYLTFFISDYENELVQALEQVLSDDSFKVIKHPLQLKVESLQSDYSSGA